MMLLTGKPVTIATMFDMARIVKEEASDCDLIMKHSLFHKHHFQDLVKGESSES